MTREKMFQTMVRGLSECVDHAREKGIIISTETLESVSVPWSSLGEMKRVLEEVPGLMYTPSCCSKFLKYCSAFTAPCHLFSQEFRLQW